MHLEVAIVQLQRIASTHGAVLSEDTVRTWLRAIAPHQDVDRALAAVAARSALSAEWWQASDIEPSKVQWLWPNRIPIAMLTMLVGDPGVGKSYVSMDIAARVSSGSSWPDNTSPLRAERVVILSAEDDAECTIVPRLATMDAQLQNIYIVGGVLRGSKTKWWELPADMVALDNVVGDLRPKLVIIDPITAYMGSADANNSAPVRALMTQLGALAHRHQTAILVISHFAKAARNNAIYRVMGSLSFIAAARMGWGVMLDPDNPRWRFLLACKHNIVERPTGLSYTIQDGRVVWSDEVATCSIESLLTAHQNETTQ